MVYKLKANATGMNMPKNQQNFFFEFRKTTRSSKYNKKFFVDEKEIPDETSVIDRKKKIEIRVSYKTGYSFLC